VATWSFEVPTNISSPFFPPAQHEQRFALGAATFAAAPSFPGSINPDWMIFYSEHLFPLGLNCLQHAPSGHLASKELLELGHKVRHQLSGLR
jgi:hypothetical protein